MSSDPQSIVADSTNPTGHLSIVATPIGNLADISPRALEALSSAAVIACEDTRHTRKLLDHYAIRVPTISYHQHNEASRTAQLIERLKAGEQIALVSDAGMPTVSDPGARLISACHREEVALTVVPGPSSVITALTGSGFPADAFTFAGFLPTKKGQRQRALDEALARSHTTAFFESPHRIVDTLAMLANADPQRLICVARELTKKFEEFRRGTAGVIAAHYSNRSVKGEITLVISGSKLPKWLRMPIHDDDAQPSPHPLNHE